MFMLALVGLALLAVLVFFGVRTLMTTVSTKEQIDRYTPQEKLDEDGNSVTILVDRSKTTSPSKKETR